MLPNLSIVKTADGSSTIYNAAVGENYHSKHGALQESEHVFLNSGLKYYLENRHTDEVSVLEVGFGTGLNFLLTADFCTKKSLHLHYTGIEAYPLDLELLMQTGYQDYVPQDLWDQFLANYSSSLQRKTTINSFCRLWAAHVQLLEFASEELFDVLYFDAFAAIHQPEMWDSSALQHITRFLKPGGVFVTYAITGNLKRSMKSLGFSVEKAPGAPGKREMLRAIKLAD